MNPPPLGTTNSAPHQGDAMNRATAGRQIQRLTRVGIPAYRLTTFGLGQGMHYVLVEAGAPGPAATLRTAADVDAYLAQLGA